MTLRDEIDTMLLCHIPRENERKEIVAAILQAVEKVVPGEELKIIRHGKPQNTRFNKRVEGFNQCRSAMLKKIRGEG